MKQRWFDAKKAARAAYLRLERLEDRNAPSDSLSSLTAPLSNWDVSLDDFDSQDSPQFHSNSLDRALSAEDDALVSGGAELSQSSALTSTLGSAPLSELANWVPHGVDLSNVSFAQSVDLGGMGEFSPDQAHPHLINGLTPVITRHAYGFDKLSGYDGSGRTIAIVDAYNAKNILSDMQTFNKQFGLQQFNVSGGPTFKVVSQTGGSSLPSNNSGWALEIALDVEWAHAIAPKANILLVEARSASYSDLMAAVSYASSNSQVVSMSWGSGEWGGETSFDAYFNKSGVAFVASSGDNSYGAGYPAISPYVLSVGGTTLSVDSSGNRLSETGWSGSGGGISSVEAEPAYQKNFGITNTGGRRANPDVSYDADPNTGVYVYSSPNGGWFIVGGTSAAAPQWAGLIALADQGRAARGLGMLSTNNFSNSPFYSAAAAAVYHSNYYDITSGSNGGASAHTGYDFVTGLGSPNAVNLVPYLSTH
jgi:subtilase family serine protease